MISWTQFQQEAETFCKFLPQWEWTAFKVELARRSANLQNVGYIRRKDILMKYPTLKHSSATHFEEKQVDDLTEIWIEPDLTQDDYATLKTTNDECHIYDFQIVYSSSYQVPVMYFNARKQGTFEL